MDNVWVDFKAIKAAVTIEMVLGHYGVNWLGKKGDELRGRCPIHKGEGTDTFHANLAKNAFQCFSCKKRGNILDFVAAMEQCTVRDAAVKLTAWFSMPATFTGDQPTRTAGPTESRGEEAGVENRPLRFQLKGVNPDHAYLSGRGFDRKTAELFGIGFFPGKGSMSGRVVIPIHNKSGELVAYAGRAIDNTQPKYKLPPGFHKGAELYNLHRAVLGNEAKVVVVVEGFFDCLRVYQAGFPCVSLMGCVLSQRQEELLVSHFRTCWLMLDGDDAGRTAAAEIAGRLVRRMFVKVVEVGVGSQPDQLNGDEIRSLLNGQ